MIDFVSTHPNADQQTVACARLLAAVIAQAIEDASSKHSSGSEAQSAVAWLFDEDTNFAGYAALIGADPQAMRKALLEPHRNSDVDPKHSRFDEGRRRVFRINHIAYLKRRQLEREAQEQMGAATDAAITQSKPSRKRIGYKNTL